MRILIIEDNVRLAENISQLFKKSNYIVTCVYNGEDGLDFALTGIYDIIVLDTKLPKMDGITLLKTLRKRNLPTPVILISDKNTPSDIVIGLDSGADDYLAKPFSPEVLMARIRALGRRKGGIVMNNILSFGDIELNTSNFMLSTQSSEINLTRREYELLEFLILRKGMISPKETIIEKLWGFDSKANANHVEVYISFLRKKLYNINSKVTIDTIRGAGYELKYTENTAT
ncbi:response regulator transcription factor [Acetivibrio straminisolvens]|jgi:DNA-binding response OmpR family regulator|uniref:Stage 0 sporulation protein A homolog n=1 Tax=Acetivibrio straminisolvens JCM 21531 TaxID=1294263 RepID=W4V0F6_9FIRM|nr:response regulator transcription factor [Acetivibrio straminisolvens]GAE86955.1 regulation of D-alanyl-lipoteichoic acid biosynthesis [Acetivibrio straminisolvens JCM 21531]